MSEVCESCETFFGGQHFSAGIEFEQARIINLLEGASIGFEQFDFDSAVTTNFLIRLIKGETE